MKSETKNRIITDLAAFFSLLFLPWWLTVILGFYLVLYFDNPFEVLVLGISVDALYGVPSSGFFASHVFFLGASIWLVASLWLKEYLVFKL